MAARDILNLENALAPRLIRILYIFALILITVGVIVGLVRGGQMATRIPAMSPLPMTAPTDAAPQAQMQERQLPDLRPGEPGMRGLHFGHRHMFAGDGFEGRHRFGMMGVRRHPALFGALIMVRSVVIGVICLLVVRVLAEMGLAILAMPRRSDT